MTLRTREVPLEELSAVLESDWADTTRRPYVTRDIAYVPVREGYMSTGNLAPRQRYRGRGYQMIGPIAMVRGMRPVPEEVKQIVDWQQPQGILWVRMHSGVCRYPVTEVLYGSTGDVLHKESGLSFCIDPSKIMFSQGNRIEKMRVATLVHKGERVADMYAGIGYFTLPVARAGGIVHAMEINPVAFRYLQKNIVLNHLSARVAATCGDCRSLLSGLYDRVIMGHFDSPGAISHVLPHVQPGSILHVHSSGSQPPDISREFEAGDFEADISVRVVKKTAPHCWHYVQDVTLA